MFILVMFIHKFYEQFKHLQPERYSIRGNYLKIGAFYFTSFRSIRSTNITTFENIIGSENCRSSDSWLVESCMMVDLTEVVTNTSFCVSDTETKYSDSKILDFIKSSGLVFMLEKHQFNRYCFSLSAGFVAGIEMFIVIACERRCLMMHQTLDDFCESLINV